MSTSRRSRIVVLLTALVGLVVSGVALAAAPLPKPASAYSTGGYKHGLSMTLVIAPSGRAVEKGGAALGSEFALSEGALQCPKAKKGHGFHEVPFTIFGFPGASLKLSGGRYGFSKTETMSDTTPLGSTAKPFTLKVKIAATVASSTSIVGTVKATGGPCTSKGPLRFNAKFSAKDGVAPGQ
jgi:hypothetical protein